MQNKTKTSGSFYRGIELPVESSYLLQALDDIMQEETQRTMEEIRKTLIDSFPFSKKPKWRSIEEPFEPTSNK